MSLSTKSITWKQLSGTPGFDDFGGVSLGGGKPARTAKSKPTGVPGIYVTENDEAIVVRDGKWHPIWELGHIIGRGDFIADATSGGHGGGKVLSAHDFAYTVSDPFDKYAYSNQICCGNTTDGLQVVKPGTYLISFNLSWDAGVSGDTQVDLIMENTGVIASHRGVLRGKDQVNLSTYFYQSATGTNNVYLSVVTGTAPSRVMDFVFIRMSLNKA